MKIKPKICVLLATYNGVEWIADQLNSIDAQVDVDVDIFVSDDRSTDATFLKLERFRGQHCGLYLLPPVERFGGAAPNFFRLIRDTPLCNYDYVALSDQDDVWNQSKLKRAYTQMIETSSDAYSSDVIAVWRDGRRRVVRKSQSQRKWDYLFEAAGPGCTYVLTKKLALDLQSCVIAQRAAIDKVGLHDWFIYAFARANGYRWTIDRQPGMLYRQHGENQVGVNVGLRAYVSRAKKITSGWGLEQAKLITSIVGVQSREVERWFNGGRLGLLSLAFNARSCRRRIRDCVIFFFACLLLAILR